MFLACCQGVANALHCTYCFCSGYIQPHVEIPRVYHHEGDFFTLSYFTIANSALMPASTSFSHLICSSNSSDFTFKHISVASTVVLFSNIAKLAAALYLSKSESDTCFSFARVSNIFFRYAVRRIVTVVECVIRTSCDDCRAIVKSYICSFSRVFASSSSSGSRRDSRVNRAFWIAAVFLSVRSFFSCAGSASIASRTSAPEIWV